MMRRAFVSTLSFTFVTALAFAQPQQVSTVELRAMDANAGDAFGRSVAVSGDTVVVGAPGDDERGVDAGAAYVFGRTATGQWVQRQKLMPPELAAGHHFGWSVAVDGDCLAVGAPGDNRNAFGQPDPTGTPYRGAAYIFEYGAGAWRQATRLQPLYLLGGDQYGWAVAVSGNAVAVSAPYRDVFAFADVGLVALYRRTAAGWTTEAEWSGSGVARRAFGHSIALDGPDLLIGGPTYGAGQVQRLRRTAEGTWTDWSQPVSGSIDGRGDGARLSARSIARDVDGTLLLVESGKIRRVAAEGTVSTWLTDLPATTLANLAFYPSLVVDATGDLWFATSVLHSCGKVCRFYVNTIYRHARDGSLVQVVPVVEQNSWFGYATSDGSDGVFVVLGCAIRHYDASGAMTREFGTTSDCRIVDGTTEARFSRPTSLSLAAGGVLYAADGGELRSVTLATGQVTTHTSEGQPRLFAVAAGSNGTLWALSDYYYGLQVYRVINGQFGAALAGRPEYFYARPIDGLGAEAFIGASTAVATADGQLALLDSYSRVRVVTPAGEVRTLAGGPTLPEAPDAHYGYALAVRNGVTIEGSPRSPLYLTPTQRVGAAGVFARRDDAVLPSAIEIDGEAFGSRYGTAVAITGDGLVALGPSNGCLWMADRTCGDEFTADVTPPVVPVRLFRHLADNRWAPAARLPVPNVAPRSGYGSALSADRDLLVAGAPEWYWLPQDPARSQVLGPGRAFVYDLATLDADGDSMPDQWEWRFGLDADDPADAALDLDGDGRTNAEEFAAHTHPANDPAFTRYFAEGAASGFFETRLALANPGDADATVALRFLTAAGAVHGTTLSVPARTSRKVIVNDVPGMAVAEFSTTIESDHLVVADRLMTWSRADRYGSHGERALVAPQASWYLAEGATHSGFQLFYLLQNPGDTAADVRITYLRPSRPPLEKTYRVEAASRRTVWVNTERFPGDDAAGPALASTDVSAIVDAVDATPLIVERAMYRTAPGSGGPTFEAGHAATNPTTPQRDWFFAEGATGAFFDLFFLVANPWLAAAELDATYLLQDGTTYTTHHSVPGQSRYTIWVDQETFPGVPGTPLAEAEAVSTTFRVTGVSTGVVIERAMWWPGPAAATWTEAHASAGATTTATAWAAAEGEVRDAPRTDTYYLVANPTEWEADVQVTLLFEDGTSPMVATRHVPARSRANLDVRALFPGAVGRRFGAVIQSLPPGPGGQPVPIVVEWALYSDALGTTWAAGANALATPLR